MKNFEKKYQLWISSDGGYQFKEFDSLQECVSEPKYSDWYITKRVIMNVTDADEQLPIITSVPIYDQQPLPAEVRSDDMDDAAAAAEAAYLRGATGTVTES